MGIYDHVLLEKPIKCKCGNGLKEFQTINFDNFMNTYIFTKDNKIKIQLYELKENPEKKAIKIRDSKWIWPLKKVVTGESVLNFTDIIYFHIGCKKCHSWIDVAAVIVNGKVNPFEIELRSH